MDLAAFVVKRDSKIEIAQNLQVEKGGRGRGKKLTSTSIWHATAYYQQSC